MERKDIVSSDGQHKVELQLSPEELEVLQSAMDALNGLASNSEGLLDKAKQATNEESYRDIADYHFMSSIHAPFGIFAVKNTVAMAE
jgi:hypothetical protein